MGANRLASNSLLECLVFGKRASEKAAKQQAKVADFELPKPVHVDRANEELFLKYQNELAGLMSEHLGIVRNKASLQKALERFKEIEDKFDPETREYNILKIRNTVSICKLIAQSALIREESRGGHIREDFQKENPDFKVHIIQEKEKEIRFENVRD
jgi:L-aspartate oxidase